MSDRPMYRQIADILRADVMSRTYAPGSQLPSEHELTERYDVERQTIRRALDVLRAEGLIISRKGIGHFVREQPILRRLTTELTTRSDQRGWYAALDRSGLRPAVRTSIGRRPVPAEIADWLGLEAGADVLVRERVMGVEGERPIQHATSYIPLGVTEHVPQLEQLDTGPGGMLSRLEDAGYGPLYFDEIIRGRRPTTDEARVLQLDAGTPVLVVYRITYSKDGEVLDAMQRIIASDRCELLYRFGAEGTD